MLMIKHANCILILIADCILQQLTEPNTGRVEQMNIYLSLLQYDERDYKKNIK